MNKFDKSLYNDEFFAWHKENTEYGEMKAGESLIKNYEIRSLVDFGCGIGGYLLGAYLGGAQDVQGYEIGGDHAKKYSDGTIIPYIHFFVDITKPMTTKQYDIAMCIEVAEHVETKDSEQLVKNVTSASDLIIWSSAPPGQTGCGHINEQPEEFWIRLFENEGFQQDMSESLSLINLWRGDAPDYVINNLIVFRRI